MTTFLIIVLVALVIMTVVSLVRGIAAFLASAKEDLNRPEDAGPSASQLMQSRMMMRRIMFQGAAVIVVALLLSLSGK